jgi:hypothetical protein
MSHKVQLDADHTLEAAKRKVRQSETEQEQQVQLKSKFQEEGLSVEAIRNRGAGASSQKFNKRTKPSNETAGHHATTRNKCIRCGS